MAAAENLVLTQLPEGFAEAPPRTPWGINFGGGLNSTAALIECRSRGFKPDWVLFADTGSELPGTLEHVERMRRWCEGWAELATVRWERTQGDIKGFEPLHENCLRTGYLPSKAYGYAGCTTKWKIQPMERWRRERGFDTGAFAVGYDAGEMRRIKTACERGDDPRFVAWYPLVAWNIDRPACEAICGAENISVGKSSCFMCPNMRKHEWVELAANHPKFYRLALEIESKAFAAGNPGPRPGLFKGSLAALSMDTPDQEDDTNTLEDRCHHGGCFT